MKVNRRRHNDLDEMGIHHEPAPSWRDLDGEDGAAPDDVDFDDSDLIRSAPPRAARREGRRCSAQASRLGAAAREPAPARTARPGWLRRAWSRTIHSPVGRQARAVGFPAMLAVSIFAGLAAFPPSREAGEAALRSFYAGVMSRPELQVRAVSLIGAQRVTSEDVVAALALDEEGRSALTLDVHSARERITALGWVADADVSLRPPQLLEVTLRERVPAALWRIDGGLKLLDASGVEIAPVASRRDWPGAPLVVGAGAAAALDEALALYQSARLASLPILGLTRVGNRRWDIELVDGPRILLPETEPFEAIETISRWIVEHDLLSRDVTRVDLRLPNAPTLRRAPRWSQAPPEEGLQRLL